MKHTQYKLIFNLSLSGAIYDKRHQYYHIGIKYKYDKITGDKIAYVIQLRKNKCCLELESPELLVYVGEEKTSKCCLKQYQVLLDDWLNKLNNHYNTNIKKILVD